MKKWKPKIAERYYYISQSGTVCGTVAGTGNDTIFRIATGNCFKTYDFANKVLKKHLQDLGFKLIKWGKVEIDRNSIPSQYLPRSNYFPNR